jgi:hypothetical protein
MIPALSEHAATVSVAGSYELRTSRNSRAHRGAALVDRDEARIHRRYRSWRRPGSRVLLRSVSQSASQASHFGPSIRRLQAPGLFTSSAFVSCPLLALRLSPSFLAKVGKPREAGKEPAEQKYSRSNLIVYQGSSSLILAES